MARQRPRDRRPRKRVDAVVTLDKEYVEQMREAESIEAEKEEDSAPSSEEEAASDPAAQEERPAPALDDDAHPFGPEGKAWMKVEIPEDHGQATLTALSFGGEKLQQQAVVDALREIYHIERGFKKKTLKEAIKKAKKDAVARGAFVVAKSKPAQRGEDGRVDILFQGEVEEPAVLPYQALRDALGRDALDAVLEKDIMTVLVSPGETLARLVPPTPGTPGKDIFGKAIEEPGEEARLTAGVNVTREEAEFVAQSYGYACIIEDVISVVSPIWVSPDFQEAHFIHFPQGRKEPGPQSEWLTQEAQRAGVTSGLDEAAVEKLCAGSIAATDKEAIAIAHGRPPVAGVDAHVDYSFDPSKRAGHVQDDGTIDFRERNTAIGVTAGTLIGESVPATPGESGRDVKGGEVAATDGQDRVFTAGQNVRTESRDEGTAFVAVIDGAVNVAGDTIEVQPVFAVNGDVNYDSGNIDLPTNVDIGGSVISGFSVKAGGSVTIGGAVENGATVQARGDVIVAKGIFGAETKVVALGNVATKFIQNSTVMAHENVTVGAYIINGIVRAGGEVKVEEGGGSNGGSIVGGEVIAGRRIEAKRLGSADTDRTVVGISGNADQLERMGELQRTIGGAEAQIPELVRTLGVTRADIGEIEAQLDRATVRRRQDLEEPSRRLKELIRSREQALEEQGQLESQIAGSVAQGVVAATDTVYADVYVQFGAETSRVSDDIKAVEFHFRDGIRWRPFEPGGQPNSTNNEDQGNGSS